MAAREATAMETLAGAWLSDLIRANLSSLTEYATTVARAQVPWYRSVPPEQLQGMFATTYQILAQTLLSGDIAPMRGHMEQAITERLRQGAPVEDILQLSTLLEAGVADLIRHQPGADPQRVAGAERLLVMTSKNMRLIISGINLRLLSRLPPVPPA
jgi:hypothetical protein